MSPRRRLRAAKCMREQYCTAQMVAQDNEHGEIELQSTQSAEAVSRKTKVAKSNTTHTLVEDGWCWWYRKYAPADTVLEELEAQARDAKQGLWADHHPIPPWEWRKGHS